MRTLILTLLTLAAAVPVSADPPGPSIPKGIAVEKEAMGGNIEGNGGSGIDIIKWLAEESDRQNRVKFRDQMQSLFLQYVSENRLELVGMLFTTELRGLDPADKAILDALDKNRMILAAYRIPTIAKFPLTTPTWQNPADPKVANYLAESDTLEVDIDQMKLQIMDKANWHLLLKLLAFHETARVAGLEVDTAENPKDYHLTRLFFRLFDLYGVHQSPEDSFSPQGRRNLAIHSYQGLYGLRGKDLVAGNAPCTIRIRSVAVDVNAIVDSAMQGSRTTLGWIRLKNLGGEQESGICGALQNAPRILCELDTPYTGAECKGYLTDRKIEVTVRPIGGHRTKFDGGLEVLIERGRERYEFRRYVTPAK
jgi:hypothetical protein